MQVFMNDVVKYRTAILLIFIVGLFSLVPRVEASFIPSEESFSDCMRERDTATIRKALENKLVKERLGALGYTDEEIASRLNQLSDEELHSFATQLDSLNPGGNALSVIIALLVIVLLVILIIKLLEK